MKTIGIIAGSGDLPIFLVKEYKKKNVIPYIVLLKDFVSKKSYKSENYIEINFGEVGKAITFFKKNDVKKIIFAGGVKKPNLKDIRPDFKGYFLLMRLLKCKFFGDNEILEVIINFLKKEGFEVLSINELSSELKICNGINGNVDFKKDYLIDIELGIKVLKKLGELDVGQSVVIQNGIVLGIECIEGTEELIKRCCYLKYLKSSRKPILVKIKKTKQTKKIDLPSIGEKTILQLKNAGFAGIAFDSENGIIINKEKAIELANKNEIFIYGIKV